MNWKNDERFASLFKDSDDPQTLREAELYLTLEQCFELLIRLENETEKPHLTKRVEEMLADLNNQMRELESRNDKLGTLDDPNAELPRISFYVLTFRAARVLYPNNSPWHGNLIKYEKKSINPTPSDKPNFNLGPARSSIRDNM